MKTWQFWVLIAVIFLQTSGILGALDQLRTEIRDVTMFIKHDAASRQLGLTR